MSANGFDARAGLSNNVKHGGGSAARSVFEPIGAKPAAVNDVGVPRRPQARWPARARRH